MFGEGEAESFEYRFTAEKIHEVLLKEKPISVKVRRSLGEI